MASKDAPKTEHLKLEDLEKVRQEFEKKIHEIKSESDETKRKELSEAYDKFRYVNFRYWEPVDETLDDKDEKPPEKDEDGRWQLDKGGNKDPKTWKVVPMLRNPNLFKIVDDKNVNIADLYHTKENAEKAIKDAIEKAEGGIDVTPPPQPEPGGDEGPYPAKSAKMASVQRGPTQRNYASGKKPDNTIEKNVKEIEFTDYQAVVELANDCDWAHDDNFSIKLGGTHMGSGWFDNSLEVYTGRTGLGVEPDHPDTDLFVVKGPSIGDTRGKRFKYACTYFTASNKTELWTNFGDGWKKQVEGVDVGKFHPKSEVDEFQLRIDGFKERNKPPTIIAAWVSEI